MPKKDFTQVALDVVRRATGETPAPALSAVAVARKKAGQKGGPKRAATLTSERRADIARIAANARWKKGA